MLQTSTVRAAVYYIEEIISIGILLLYCLMEMLCLAQLNIFIDLLISPS